MRMSRLAQKNDLRLVPGELLNGRPLDLVQD